MGERCKVYGKLFGIWIGPPMVAGQCPMTSEPGICQDALNEAHAAAMRRKVCPEAFDVSGKILPDWMIRVIDAMEVAGLDPWTGRPVGAGCGDG